MTEVNYYLIAPVQLAGHLCVVLTHHVILKTLLETKGKQIFNLKLLNGS